MRRPSVQPQGLAHACVCFRVSTRPLQNKIHAQRLRYSRHHVWQGGFHDHHASHEARTACESGSEPEVKSLQRCTTQMVCECKPPKCRGSRLSLEPNTGVLPRSWARSSCTPACCDESKGLVLQTRPCFAGSLCAVALWLGERDERSSPWLRRYETADGLLGRAGPRSDEWSWLQKMRARSSAPALPPMMRNTCGLIPLPAAVGEAA